MPKYRATVDYQTETTANSFTCELDASDEEAAIDQSQKECRRRRKVLKIDGGSVKEIGGGR